MYETDNGQILTIIVAVMKKMINKLHGVTKLCLVLAFLEMVTVMLGYTAYAQTANQYYTLNEDEGASPKQNEMERVLSLKMLLEEIESSHNISFFYDDRLVDNIAVAVPAGESDSLAQFLGDLLTKKGLIYKKQTERTYVIMEKPANARSWNMQQEAISGSVSDAQSGENLPGVNILVKGTSIGASTDENGNFELEVPSLQDTLVVTYIGYQRQEVPIAGRQELTISLQPQAVAGEEVIVTALGIARESRSTGYATSSVSSEQLTVNRSANFMNSLQGQVAGVNIEAVSSGAGGSSRVRIRGQSSFGSNNSPLIVVDGIPISNEGNFAEMDEVDGVIDGGDGFGSINQDAIESMTVLKGAPAAALYGSRAKDGAIIITTKRDAGDRGIGVSFNSNVQVAIPYDDRDIQTEYGQGEGGQRPTSSFPGSGVWSFGEKIEPGMTQTLFDGQTVPYEIQPSHVENFMRNAYTVNNSINLATGGPGGGVNLSVSQLDEESMVPNSNFIRHNIGLGFTQNVTENLNVSGNIHYSREKNNMPVAMNNQVLNVPTPIYTLSNTMPLDLMKENRYDDQGNEIFYSRFAHRTNPFITTDPDKRINDSQRDRIFGNITLRYDFTDWLYLQGRLGQEYFTRHTEVNTPTGLAYMAPAPEGFYNGRYDENLTRFREINADFLLGVEQQVTERLGISGRLGGNIMNRRNDSNTQSGIDFVVRDLYTLENARQLAAGYNYYERQVNSLYGSLEFDYNNILYVNLTGRNDWFSTLDPEERSILYPSINASFVFSEILNGRPEWLTEGSLRAGYAEVGSDTDVNFAAGQLIYDTNDNLYPGIGGSMRALGGIDGNTLPVSGLKPMRVKEYEVGIDLRLFRDVLNIDFTYYNKRSIDQILNQSISTATGFSQRPINVGENVNRGIELLVDLIPVQKGDFIWNLRFNGSYNETEVISLGEETDNLPVGNGDWQTAGGTLRHVVGHPMGEIWVTGYQRDNEGQIIINQNNGMPMTTSEPINFGTAIPKYIGGISNSFNYKNIGLSFLIDFKLGHKLLSGLEHNLYRHGLDPRTLEGRETGSLILDGVTPDGAVNQMEVDVYQLYTGYGSLREQFIHDAGYWKLRQVTLDYNLTSLVRGFLPVQDLELSVVGNHLLVLKKWTPQHDPEQVSFTGDDNVGISGAALPMTRNIGFNLKVEF